VKNMGAIEAFEKVIEEIIALGVVIPTVAMVFLDKPLPEFWKTAFALVVGFYFAKKTVNGNGGIKKEEVEKIIEEKCEETQG
jgi:hypothetical protein